MNLVRYCLAAVALSASVAPITAQDSNFVDPFERADASFSRFAMNVATTPQAIGRLTNGDECDDDMILCNWQDDSGVNHTLVGDVIAIKSISADVAGDNQIRALDIGTARSRSAVLARVRAFLPEISVDCLEPDDAGEGEGIASCSGSFEKGGWFKLLFDSNNQLVIARIDAFQIN